MKSQLLVLGCLAFGACLGQVAAAMSAPPSGLAWTPTTWRGEQAYELVTDRWHAIVSADRGRLVHFGRADAGAPNLLFETDSRSNPFSWGGHRVWLGPQALWGWPPPDAWERSAAEQVSLEDGRIELQVPDAGDGFPRMTRIYELDGDRLACRIAVSGGTRSVQVMQILQMPAATTTELRAEPTAKWPRGYFRVGGGEGPVMVPDLALPAAITEMGHGEVRMAYFGRSDKLAFAPQTIVARTADAVLRLEIGASRGEVEATPDDGYYTQVYVGHPGAPVVEIEQFSPQWQAGEDGEFSMYIDLTTQD